MSQQAVANAAAANQKKDGDFGRVMDKLFASHAGPDPDDPSGGFDHGPGEDADFIPRWWEQSPARS